MPEFIHREWEGCRPVLRLGASFDRQAAWALRDRVEHETAPEILVDFTQVREQSDLAIAVLAHGVQCTRRRMMFRGLGAHQLRIFRYCGVALEIVATGDAIAAAPLPPAERRV
jgi:anti-anti-sigma regulatory factor